MDDFILNIIKGRSVEPTSQVEKAFCNYFSSAVNIEWFIVKESIYEAIFYLDNLEHIAHFNETGNLIDYRVNLSLSDIPENLTGIFKDKGEIMNVVARFKEQAISKYEVIMRDSQLTRHLFLIDANFKIIKETQL
ncbi:MAG: hypothetical protein JXB34_07210 [Bacteroidales bacterium]|nr:hypothetical protein [Bacteroidales bacterium]